MAQDTQKAQNEIYALKVQAPDAPAGYVPVGTSEQMEAAFEKYGRSGQTVEVFRLKKDMEPLKVRVTDEALKRELEKIVSGQDDFCLCTDEMRDTVKKIREPFEASVKAGGTLARKLLKTGELDSGQALICLGAASSGIQTTRAKFEQAKSGLMQRFGASETSNFIVGRGGFFVKDSWLDNPENAERVSIMRPKAAPKAPRPTNGAG